MRFNPMRSWKVDGVDEEWNMSGLLETPWGNYYLKPLVLDSVFISKTGMVFWEGPLSVHLDNSTGALLPVVVVVVVVVVALRRHVMCLYGLDACMHQPCHPPWGVDGWVTD